jgi:hypothetical protein
MAQGKKTFIFYSDWINMVKEMPDKDAGELLKHILLYVNDENPDTDNILVRMAFGHMKPMLKADLNRWESIRETRKENGRKGGKANAKQTEANAKQLEAVNDNDNVNGNVNDNSNVNVNEKKKEQILSKKAEGEIAFNFWWDVYAIKVDRAKCLKKFLTLSIEDMRKCYDHSKLYAKAQPDKQYRRNPITYLNNENWKEDEFTKPRTTNRPGGLHSEETRNNLERLKVRWAEM